MNKVEKIRKEIERLKEETFDNKELSLEEIIAVRNCYNNLLFFIDSLEQHIKRTPADIEAAMQEIEEKSKLFTEAHKDDVVSNDTISNPLEISRHGNSHVGETLEKAAGNYAFTMSGEDEVLKYYAFIAGAQWQKERILNNAIEREVKVDAGGYPYIDVTELYDYDKDKPLAKEGDKVKLTIIMEE